MENLKKTIMDLTNKDQYKFYTQSVNQLDPLIQIECLESLELEEIINNSNLMTFAIYIIMKLNITYNVNNTFTIDDGAEYDVYPENSNIFKIINYVFAHTSIKKTIQLSMHYWNSDQEDFVLMPLNENSWMKFTLLSWYDNISLKLGSISRNSSFAVFCNYFGNEPKIFRMVTEIILYSDNIETFKYCHSSFYLQNLKKMTYFHSDDHWDDIIELCSLDIPEIIYTDGWGFPLEFTVERVRDIIVSCPKVKFEIGLNVSIPNSYEPNHYAISMVKNKYLIALDSEISSLAQCNTFLSMIHGYDNFKKMFIRVENFPSMYVFKKSQFPYLKDLELVTDTCHSKELSFLPKSIEKLTLYYFEVFNSGYWTPSPNLKYLQINNNQNVSDFNKLDGVLICQEPLLKRTNLKGSSLKHLILTSISPFNAKNIYVLGGLPESLTRVSITNIDSNPPKNLKKCKWLIAVDDIKPAYQKLLFRFAAKEFSYGPKLIKYKDVLRSHVTFIERRKIIDLDSKQFLLAFSKANT